MFLYRTGQYGKARELLESVANSAPVGYRSKALLSLSAVEESLGSFEESLRLRSTASTCSDPLTLLEAQRGIAALRSVEGDHRAALRDLERLMPLAHIIGRRGHPVYYTFLNSYALELSENGRTAEAEQAATIIAASPFLSRYPEWQETWSEISSRRKRRSIVTVLRSQIEQEDEVKASQSASNVLQFPTGEPMLEIEAILESNEVREELLLTPVQLLALILKAMLKDRITDEEVEKICLLYYDTLVKWYPVD